jgi:hypothetical protein
VDSLHDAARNENLRLAIEQAGLTYWQLAFQVRRTRQTRRTLKRTSPP